MRPNKKRLRETSIFYQKEKKRKEKWSRICHKKKKEKKIEALTAADIGLYAHSTFTIPHFS